MIYFPVLIVLIFDYNTDKVFAVIEALHGVCCKSMERIRLRQGCAEVSMAVSCRSRRARIVC